MHHLEPGIIRSGAVFIEKDRMTKSQIYRKGFGLKEEIRGDVEADYGSRVMDWLRANDFELRSGRISVSLAKAFGFCYGVERAVDYAYQTVRMYPDRRVFLVGEIIHNPGVNQRLTDLGITILPGHDLDSPAYDDVTRDDVVIIPAFGTTGELFRRLQERGSILVDTTCGSVMNVWKRVRQYAKRGFTSIVHGKSKHEETRATCSQATDLNGQYLVVLNLDEARLVAEYIRGNVTREALMARFGDCVGEGFDPERDLAKIGCANQTTMLSSESLQVAEILKAAFLDRYGPDELDERFMSFDTICGATQERQDAVVELLDTKPDLMVIVGGYNSSNTMHLVELAAERVPTYFIRDSRLIESAERIAHRDVETGEDRVSAGWLPDGPVRVGVTAGASCPDNQIGETVARVLEVAGVAPPDVSLDVTRG